MRHQGLKGWTITSALRPLSIILAQAARRGRIPVNPLTQLERGERPRHDDQRPKRILSLEEMQALLEHADSEQYRCLLELMLAAGLRIGEALGLAVCDLDRKHSLIRVECQLDRDGQRTPLKTEESQRAIDIPPQLMRRLLALVEERGRLFNPGALVFASRNETGLVRKVAREALKRAVKAARLAPPEPTLHDLRHSHASMLIALDVSVVDVQCRLGHRKPDTPSASTPTSGRSARPGAARSACNSASSSPSAKRCPPLPRARHGWPCRQRPRASTHEGRSNDRPGTDRRTRVLRSRG